MPVKAPASTADSTYSLSTNEEDHRRGWDRLAWYISAYYTFPMSRRLNGLDAMSANIRCSQRAPRSCMRCAAKRIKCDKSIPCHTCIARGLEATCTRETVRVKGKVISGSPGDSEGSSYSELIEENRRLKAALRHNASVGAGDMDLSWPHGEMPTITESFENDVHPAILNGSRPSSVHSLADIWMPNERCSHFLLEHGIVWTAWIHSALHVPTFRLEHRDYWQQSESIPLSQRDPFWLAIYFAFLAVTLIFLDEEEAAKAELPHGIVKHSFESSLLLMTEPDNIVTLLENWYDASIFFLNQADYLRQHDIRTVQTIAILLGLYKGMGDFSLHSTHLACGIRIAQTLHLNYDSLNSSKSVVDREVRRRVWWTLVICEWLQRPHGVSLVRESDFDVALPLDLDDEELPQQELSPYDSTTSYMRPRPVQYHLAMIAIARLWYRFRTALVKVRHNPENLESLVLQTDEALANVINELPLHLQEDATTLEGGAGPPWIAWQRNSLSMSILYYRMAINRVLQDQWVQSPNSYARTQAICLGSAQAIVSLVDRYAASSARNRPWAIASNLFSAAITLAVEARFSDAHTAAAHIDDVKRCIIFLTTIKDRNVVAARAIEILDSCLTASDIPWPVPFP